MNAPARLFRFPAPVRYAVATLVVGYVAWTRSCGVPDEATSPAFVLADSARFAMGRALTNAVADYDSDGDLDLFVGFNGHPNRLYRNDGGRFTDVARFVGIADSGATRAAAWGDFDRDGHPDLFVAFGAGASSYARLYQGDGRRFVDVAPASGITAHGAFRQAAFVDYDGDGDSDLYIAFRDTTNALFLNDDGRFTDVAAEVGLADARRSVGASWFDYDQDGDLDLVVANMDGDANGLFRNDGLTFTDVAAEAGLAGGGRPLGIDTLGTVRPTVVDYDGDGWFDVFMANYGPNGLFRNLGNGTFENVADRLGLAVDGRYDAGVFSDMDLDGDLDLFVNGTVTGGRSWPDYLYRNDGEHFVDVTPGVIGRLDVDHGAVWFDADKDGDPDLALTGAAPTGSHHLLLNTGATGRSLSIDVPGASAGWEVRLFDAANGSLLGSQLVDSGSGYNAQNLSPLLFGIPGGVDTVDVELTKITGSARLAVRIERVNPEDYLGRNLRIE